MIWTVGVLLAGIAVIVALSRIGRRTRPILVLALALGIASLALGDLDAFGAFFAALALSVLLLASLSARIRHEAYDLSILLIAIGAVIAIFAQDLLLLYLGIELATVPAYVLVAARKTGLQIEAAVKYFISGIVASAFLLLGIVLLAISMGTTSIAGPLELSGLSALGIASLLSGLAFKLGAWPFNFWIPDVYQASESEVAGLLAGASKKVAFAVLIRLSLLFIPAFPGWQASLAILAALSMTIPNIVALAQQDLRRLLAYSIMTHSGYLLMGVAAAGYAGVLFHAGTHAFMALGAFLALGALGARDLQGLQGLGFRNPLLGAALTVFLLSLAGIPLLSGFASKLAIFLSAAQAFPWLVALAVANSALALYYYFRIIRSLYGFAPGGRRAQVSRGMLFAIGVCLAVTVLLGIYPQAGAFLAEMAVHGLF